MVKYVWIEKDIIILHLKLPQIITQVNKYPLHPQGYGRISPQSYDHHLVIHIGKGVLLEWNQKHWKIKKIVIFGHLQKL